MFRVISAYILRKANEVSELSKPTASYLQHLRATINHKVLTNEQLLSEHYGDDAPTNEGTDG